MKKVPRGTRVERAPHRDRVAGRWPVPPRRGLPLQTLPSILHGLLTRSPLVLKLGALAAVASTSALAGCFAPPDERPDAEAAATTATAVVVVERTTGPGDTVRGDALIARFVRVHQGNVDEQALRIAGAAFDLPALGTCSAERDVLPTLQPRSVEMLDVGVLTVDSPARKPTVLLPRSMPDPTGVVSGVFYSARSADTFTASASNESRRLQLHTSGGPDIVAGFRVDVPSPRDVSEVRVSASTSGLVVTWDADASTSDGRDIVYVDVIGASARLVARCTTLDSGQLTVPPSALGAIEDGQISVHRQHREAFRAKGIDRGEVRFDVARVVTFHR